MSTAVYKIPEAVAASGLSLLIQNFSFSPAGNSAVTVENKKVNFERLLKVFGILGFGMQGN